MATAVDGLAEKELRGLRRGSISLLAAALPSRTARYKMTEPRPESSCCVCRCWHSRKRCRVEPKRKRSSDSASDSCACGGDSPGTPKASSADRASARAYGEA